MVGYGHKTLPERVLRLVEASLRDLGENVIVERGRGCCLDDLVQIVLGRQRSELCHALVVQLRVELVGEREGCVYGVEFLQEALPNEKLQPFYINIQLHAYSLTIFYQ